MFQSSPGPYNLGKPMKLTIMDRLKVVDIACGKVVTHVKALSLEDVTVSFFAILDQFRGKTDEETLMSYYKIVGLESMSDYFGNYIKCLSLDTSKVMSFASGKSTAYMIMQQQASQDVSMVPQQPNVKGLVHFYQETQAGPDGRPIKKWIFITQ